MSHEFSQSSSVPEHLKVEGMSLEDARGVQAVGWDARSTPLPRPCWRRRAAVAATIMQHVVVIAEV